mgnify:CR=1 FL=1
MFKINYKQEEFLSLNGKMINDLNKLASELKRNLRDPKKSFIVSELIAIRNFNKAWSNIKPNNISNSYSKNEFKGIYAFAINKGSFNVCYIGISRTIRRRFYDHANGLSENRSSWVFLMAKQKMKDKYVLLTKREKKELFKKIQKDKVHSCKFTFVTINDNMFMHLAEVYCVNILHSFYNSFETH